MKIQLRGKKPATETDVVDLLKVDDSDISLHQMEIPDLDGKRGGDTGSVSSRVSGTFSPQGKGEKTGIAAGKKNILPHRTPGSGKKPSGEPVDAALADPDNPEKKGGFLAKLKQIAPVFKKREKYDVNVHGQLVDLSYSPPTGVEEIEMYPVQEPYAYIRITYNYDLHEYLYQVLEPTLTATDHELLKELKKGIFERVDVNVHDITSEKALLTLEQMMNEILSDYGIKLSPRKYEKIFYQLNKDFLGDGLIDAVMHDKYIEDISCDGVGKAIFVFHSRYESVKTSLIYNDPHDLDSFVTKLAQRAGKHISVAEPLLDATMKDGSRIQMSLGSEVTAHGSTFTIRKFRDEPITPTDLIEWGTFSPLSIAFLWLAVESGKSCIFAGGTASGKTTSLNAISLFIPPLAKIVSIEDTRELKLPHPNWIPSVTRETFDVGGRGQIDMYELLKAALRQRPEYLIVGEVRGREAQTLFQAMSTGHVTYSTMHADSVASVVHRIENPPLSVPRNMLSALDLVSVQVQAQIGGQRIRRNKQIIEILDIDPRTNELITNEVFKWRQVSDEIMYSGKSFILEEIMEAKGWDEERITRDLLQRQEVLEWMRVNKMRDFAEVSNIIVSYFRDPESVMDKVRSGQHEQL
ncbi:MAG: type II/IV secretion system ATPase subunit [Methanospirillaceae archaeon]|nr:type II/IV secretion system ATPase subunit [Methanospirillaceae archaeon]